jgi:hypothetical protein
MGHDKQSATDSLDLSVSNQAASKHICIQQRDPKVGKLRSFLNRVAHLKGI